MPGVISSSDENTIITECGHRKFEKLIFLLIMSTIWRKECENVERVEAGEGMAEGSVTHYEIVDPTATYAVLGDSAMLPDPVLDNNEDHGVYAVLSSDNIYSDAGNFYGGDNSSRDNLYSNADARETNESRSGVEPSEFIYSRLDRSVSDPSISRCRINTAESPNAISVDQVNTAEESQKDYQPTEKKRSMVLVLLVLVLIVLLIAIVAGGIALTVAFLRIASLRSELNLAMMSQINGSSPENPVSFQLRLERDITDFMNSTEARLRRLVQNVNASTNLIDEELEYCDQIQRQVNLTLHEVESKVADLNKSVLMELQCQSTRITSNITTLEGQLTQSFSMVETVVSLNVSDLSSALVRDIQTIHTFDSCGTVMNLSLPFPAGMYMIQSSSAIGPIQVYCSTSIAFSCNGVLGQWRRVAFLNASSANPLQCPGDLQVRNSDPPSCVHAGASSGCSAVDYETNGMEYSQVCGRVHGRYSLTPDGFLKIGRPQDVSIEGNYVDGVSLTYGRNPRNHIWTFTATIDSSVNDCSECGNKPDFVMNDYSCELVRKCPGDTRVCSSDVLWDGESQCVGGERFSVVLEMPTTADIEMRVCRDQGRSDEDILVTFVEIFVM